MIVKVNFGYGIGQIINRVLHFWYNTSYERKNQYLRALGCKVGKSTRIICDTSFVGSEPYLVEIGEDNFFSNNVKLFTHDGGAKVINSLYCKGAECDKVARIKIGNNCFIGNSAMIMPGITIGDNCIIGAGSIVSKNIPNNSVAAGVPCRVICSIEEYYRRNKEKGLWYKTAKMSKNEKRKYLETNVPEL